MAFFESEIVQDEAKRLFLDYRGEVYRVSDRPSLDGWLAAQ